MRESVEVEELFGAQVSSRGLLMTPENSRTFNNLTIDLRLMSL